MLRWKPLVAWGALLCTGLGSTAQALPAYCESRPLADNVPAHVYVLSKEDTGRSTGIDAYHSFMHDCVGDKRLPSRSIVVIRNEGINCSADMNVNCGAEGIQKAVKGGDTSGALHMIIMQSGTATVAPRPAPVQRTETVTHTEVHHEMHRGRSYYSDPYRIIGAICFTFFMIWLFCWFFWRPWSYQPQVYNNYAPPNPGPRPAPSGGPGPQPQYPQSFMVGGQNYPGAWSYYNGYPTWGYYGMGNMFTPYGYYGSGGFVGLAAYDMMLMNQIMVGEMIGAEMAMSGDFGWNNSWDRTDTVTDTTTTTYTDDASGTADTGTWSDGLSGGSNGQDTGTWGGGSSYDDDNTRSSGSWDSGSSSDGGSSDFGGSSDSGGGGGDSGSFGC